MLRLAIGFSCLQIFYLWALVCTLLDAFWFIRFYMPIHAIDTAVFCKYFSATRVRHKQKLEQMEMKPRVKHVSTWPNLLVFRFCWSSFTPERLSANSKVWDSRPLPTLEKNHVPINMVDILLMVVFSNFCRMFSMNALIELWRLLNQKNCHPHSRFCSSRWKYQTIRI